MGESLAAAARVCHRLPATGSGGIVAKRVTPHSLRHAFAIRTLRNGTDVTALAKLLGHASVSTTMRYVDHLETAELRGSLPRLPE